MDGSAAHHRPVGRKARTDRLAPRGRGRLRDEARAPTNGGAVVVHPLLESQFADAVRSELSRMAIDASTPREALADRRIGTALARLHERPGSPWTVESLARVAVMSRSAFSERFRSIVGEAPMQYVRRLRLARAVRLLRSTDATVAEIAKDVGYTSEQGPEPRVQETLRGGSERIPPLSPAPCRSHPRSERGSPNGVRTRVSTLRVFSRPASQPATMTELAF